MLLLTPTTLRDSGFLSRRDDEFSARFSDISRKILKNAAFALKFGVDKADILLFQIEKRILIFWRYSSILALCEIKIQS